MHKFFVLLLLSVCVAWLGVASGIFSESVAASSERLEVVSSAALPYIPEEFFPCAGEIGAISVEHVGFFDNACIYGSFDEFRFARYVPNGPYAYAISFPGSSRFYEVTGVCSLPKCVYSPSTDTLVQHAMQAGWRWGLQVLPEFSKSLERRYDTWSGRVWYEFQFRTSVESTILNGASPTVEGIGISSNSRWAIVELRSLGLVRVDLQTLEARRVVAPGSEYGLANDPRYELAISDDGSLVAATGWRLGFQLVRVTDTCGDGMQPGMQRYLAYGLEPCEQVIIGESLFVPNTRYFAMPRFTGNGEVLSAQRFFHDASAERVLLSTRELPVRSALYLALGDSFTSGEGELDSSYYLPASRQDTTRCHVSRRAYPAIVAAVWDVSAHSVACSGATTRDVLGGNGYAGQSGFLDSLLPADRMSAVSAAIQTFRSGVVPQVSFVQMYQPGLVTIGIGGNDAGFMAKLKSCLSPGRCEWVDDLHKRYATGQEIASVYPKVVQVIQTMKQQSPTTNIRIVGYPRIISDESAAHCDPLVSALLDEEERRFMNQGILYLNDVLRAAAHTQAVEYVDVYSAYGDSVLCGTTTPGSMNSLRLGSTVAPLSFLENFKVLGSESFHPTHDGHSRVALRMLQQSPSVDQCSDCSGYGYGVPELLDYWGGFLMGPQDFRTQVHKPSMGDDIGMRSEAYRVSLPAGSLMAQSAVSVRLHSDEIVVLESEASADGSFGADIQLDAITDGYHTLHLYGTGADGYDIDYYKNVAIITSLDQIEPIEEVLLERPEKEVVAIESNDPTATPLPVQPAQFTTGSYTSARFTSHTLLSGPVSILGQSVGLSAEVERTPFTVGPVKVTRSYLSTIILGLSVLVVVTVLWLVFRQRRVNRRDGDSR